MVEHKFYAFFLTDMDFHPFTFLREYAMLYRIEGARYETRITVTELK